MSLLKDGGFNMFQILFVVLLLIVHTKYWGWFPIGYQLSVISICFTFGLKTTNLDYDCLGSLIYFQTIQTIPVEGIWKAEGMMYTLISCNYLVQSSST